jgi:hypothetical protein
MLLPCLLNQPGSLYFLTFCAAKRAATKMVAQHEQAAKPAAGAAAAVVGAAGAAAAGTAGGSAAHHYPHSQHSLGVDCHAHDPVFAAICSDDKASKTAAAAARQKQQQQQASATPKQQQQPAIVELSSGGKLQVNILAALSAACVGALIEAPVELFKHRAQAGQITGPMLGHVAAALKASGPAALYGSFFVPFLFKSLPFDIGELMTYSCLSDWRAAQVAAGGASKARAGSSSSSTVVAVAPPASAAAAVMSSSSEDEHHQQHVPALGSLTAAALGTAPGSSWLQPGQLVREMPDHAWDCLVGAAAGAAAVLISHPPDCIKTVMVSLVCVLCRCRCVRAGMPQACFSCCAWRSPPAILRRAPCLQETGGGVTHGAHGLALNSAAAFAATGRRMVGQQGGRGLFVGLAPRLVESVPSTMLYWLAVEGCRRLLEPYVAPESPSTPAAASG